MRKLFDFRIGRTVTETKTETSKNDKDETVTVEKEVKTNTSQVVVLRKPNRSLFDDAELFYGVRLSEGIKAGLLTRALLAKRFSNDGGILSEEDKSRYADMYLKLYELQLEMDRLTAIGESKRTKAQSQKLTQLIEEVTIIKRELTDFEMAQSSLFEQTAENRARNKTILWWTLQLSYLEDEEGTLTAVFPQDGYNEKLARYDEMEESEDSFEEELISKLLYYVSFWYVGKVNSEEDFKRLLMETEGTSEEEAEEPKKEEPKKEEPKKEEPKKEEPKKEEPKKEEPPKEVKPKVKQTPNPDEEKSG
jgi:hypothetical protein